MTVSRSHPIKKAPLLEHFLERLFPDPSIQSFRLYFVVPDSIFSDFEAQPYLGADNNVLTQLPNRLKRVEQWVLQLPMSRS